MRNKIKGEIERSNGGYRPKGKPAEDTEAAPGVRSQIEREHISANSLCLL
jgi:hypothetical protein